MHSTSEKSENLHKTKQEKKCRVTIVKCAIFSQKMIRIEMECKALEIVQEEKKQKAWTNRIKINIFFVVF